MISRLFLILAVAACNAPEVDQRPETAAYISEAILQPYCGRAACHASATAEAGYVFDTVSSSVDSLHELVTAGHSERSQLYAVIIGEDTVMPPDVPLPDRDISLIERWIDSGAEGLQ